MFVDFYLFNVFIILHLNFCKVKSSETIGNIFNFTSISKFFFSIHVLCWIRLFCIMSITGYFYLEDYKNVCNKRTNISRSWLWYSFLFIKASWMIDWLLLAQRPVVNTFVVYAYICRNNYWFKPINAKL